MKTINIPIAMLAINNKKLSLHIAKTILAKRSKRPVHIKSMSYQNDFDGGPLLHVEYQEA